MFEKIQLAENIREILEFESRLNNFTYSDDDYIELKSDKEFLKKYNSIRKSELWHRPM